MNIKTNGFFIRNNKIALRIRRIAINKKVDKAHFCVMKRVSLHMPIICYTSDVSFARNKVKIWREPKREIEETEK